MRKIYIVYDRSSRRIVNYINSAIFSAADCFPATDFTFMGTSFRGVNIDDIVEHAESRVMSGRVQKNMFNIIDELRAVVGDYQTVVLAFLATDLYYVGNGWNLDWTLGKSDYNIIVQSWHRYAQLDPTTFQCVLSHVTRHELGHVFRAAEGRKDPHGRRFFDDHCTNHLCDMYQTEGPVQTVIDHAIRVSRQPDSFCEKCRRDIVEQAHRWDPNPTDPSTVTWLYGADGSV